MQLSIKIILLVALISFSSNLCSPGSSGPTEAEVREGRLKWIELNRKETYELKGTAATQKEAISNYLSDLLSRKKDRRILSRDEYMAAFWANQPDERIMDLGKSPLVAFDMENTDRRFARHYIIEKTKNASNCSIRNIEVLKSEASGSVILHSIGQVHLECDTSGAVVLSQFAVVLEHQGQFKVASLKPR